ncbi:hypothetical protein C0V72_03115 [Porphyrobacter sp. TH134]|uniref:hypothetical protein n=1 Tax=Porphyrobacter sp. TH134 TaxID=2067450 RepID=UPI000C7A1854|nr:hypothetical protein [Porphyrobacter sp. TH134]PLK25011.1 hypothetical protein C0V72_03115 [Porphyrobacter sp. TH134]
MIFTWNIPAADGRLASEELLVAFDRGRAVRVLICPAWFDEANRLRRFTIEVMRRLDASGIDGFLPDLPGCNESLAPLENQTLAGWRADMVAAAAAVGATHVLAIRAGALIAPATLPGWHYAAQSGPKLLRGMIRARTIAAREAGMAETSEALMAQGREQGLVLGGWPLGAAMIGELETAEPGLAPGQSDIAQSALGGPGLWLRAEPDESAAQADRLAAIIAEDVGVSEG